MNEQLQNLLADWEIARQEGRELDPEEMCAQCPELLPDFKEAIARLLQTSWLFEPDTTGARSAQMEIPDPKSRAEFDDALRACGLVPDAEVDLLADELDSEQAAAKLRDAELLTEYQSEVLLGYRSGPLQLDRYIILDEIGEGGMGKVYRALHTSMNRNVAIKMLASEEISENRKQRFRREIQSVAALNHPNVVTAHDACEIDGRFFLVMELIEGNDLLHEVETGGPIPFDMTLEIVRQIASATEAAHQKGIIHRDIKPSNILLATDGKAKLLDLGIARVQNIHNGVDQGGSTIEDSTDLTGEGTPVGTVAYMSPEQALNAKSADARSDIYSLGCTLFYLLTGKPPFVGNSVVETIVSHRETSVESLLAQTDLEDKAKSLLRNMIAKDPADRFESMQALTEAMDGKEVKRTVVAASKSEHVQEKSRGGFPVQWILAAAVLLACFAGGAVWFFQNSAEQAVADSATWQNDFAKWVLNHSGAVVASTEFGEQTFDSVEAIPDSPIEITQLAIYELPTGFSAQWLTRLPGLTTLSFDFCNLTEGDVIQLRELKKLESLTFNECEVPPSLWSTLHRLPSLFVLVVNQMELTDKDCENIGTTDQLTVLTINNSGFSDRQFGYLSKLKLDFLDLDGTEVGVGPVQWAAAQSQLEHLDLSDTRLTDEQLKSVEPCRSLTLISLEGCEVGDAAVEYVMKLPKVTDVYLGQTSVSDLHLATIAKHASISYLDLQGNNVSGVGLLKFKGMDNLKYLGLANLKIDDRDMLTLASLKLDGVDLSDTGITDKGLAILAAGNLDEISIVNCDVSEDGMNAFMEQNPECLVEVEEVAYFGQ